MALDTTGLKNGIKSLLTDMRTRDAVSDDEFAERLSNLIEAFVKTGEGIYQTGSLLQSGATAVVSSGTIVKIE